MLSFSLLVSSVCLTLLFMLSFWSLRNPLLVLSSHLHLFGDSHIHLVKIFSSSLALQKFLQHSSSSAFAHPFPFFLVQMSSVPGACSCTVVQHLFCNRHFGHLAMHFNMVTDKSLCDNISSAMLYASISFLTEYLCSTSACS